MYDAFATIFPPLSLPLLHSNHPSTSSSHPFNLPVEDPPNTVVVVVVDVDDNALEAAVAVDDVEVDILLHQKLTSDDEVLEP